VLAACPDGWRRPGGTVVPTFAALAAVQDKVRAPDLEPGRTPAATNDGGAGGRWLRAWRCSRPTSNCPSARHRAASCAWRTAQAGGSPTSSRRRDSAGAWWSRWPRRTLSWASCSTGEARRSTPTCGAGGLGEGQHKRSVDLPEVRDHLTVLGADLAWHGALSVDAILVDGTPYIDVNPRLVEPAMPPVGVDLVGPLVELALGGAPPAQPPASGRPHPQALLALLGAAGDPVRDGGPGRVVAVLRATATSGAVRGTHPLRATCVRLPSVVAVTACWSIHPRAVFASNATANYA